MAEQVVPLSDDERVDQIKRTLKGAKPGDLLAALQELLGKDDQIDAVIQIVSDLLSQTEIVLNEGDVIPSLNELVRRRKTLRRRASRNRKAEEMAARNELALRAGELKVDRDAQQMEVMQIAQALIFCGLPYDSTDERQLSYRARLADGSKLTVTFTAALPDVKMPFGSDRTLLQFLIDKAVKTQKRFVGWETAVEYLTEMQLSTGGKNYADLRERFGRLRGLVIGVERDGVGVDVTKLQAVISRSLLPTSIDAKVEERGQRRLSLAAGKSAYGIEFGQEFYDDTIKYHVPVPQELLRKTRKQSQLQDICLFLHWRCYAAKSESLIPWEYLRDQMWHADKKARRIKERFAEAITFMQAIWPEMRAEVRDDGLWVAPPLGGVYLIPKGADTRRLG